MGRYTIKDRKVEPKVIAEASTRRFTAASLEQ